MRRKRRSAVRADDAQVTEAVVRRGAVDVIEDQRHLFPMPVLALTAQLTLPAQQARVVETLLELPAVVVRILDQHLVQRCRLRAPGAPERPDRLEMLGRDVVLLDQLAESSVVATRRPKPEAPQSCGEAWRVGDCVSNLLLGVPRTAWRTRTLVRATDGKPLEVQALRELGSLDSNQILEGQSLPCSPVTPLPRVLYGAVRTL
jgi:hypothetical protein